MSYINNLPSDELQSESGSDRGPPRRRAKKRRKRSRNRRQESSTATRWSGQQTNVGKNDKRSDIEQSDTVRGEGLGKSEGESGGRDNVRKIGGQSQRTGRSNKTETYANATSDSGIASATPDAETNTIDNLPKSAERKRKANVERENSAVLDGVRRSKRNKPATVGLVTQGPIPGPSTIIKTSLPQATSTPSNVNLKIDLSLFNISGQLFRSAKALTVTTTNNSMVTQSNTSQSSTPTLVKSLRSLPKRGIRSTQSTAPSNSKPEPTQTTKTKPQTSTALFSNPQEPTPKSTTQSTDKSQRKSKRKRDTASQRSNNTSSSTRDFPNSWCDDSNSESDSESDKTWSPGPDKSETDESLTEEDEILSDSSYEVLVPKTAADLLNEYKSDDTDDSWALGDEC